MMGNVIELPVVTKLDLPPERVIARAGEADLEGVVIIGWKRDGDFYFASSYADGGDVIFLCEMAKKKLLDICDQEEGRQP